MAPSPHREAQTLPSLLPLPEPIPDGWMLLTKSQPSCGVKEVGITAWSKGLKPSQNQGVPAGLRHSKPKGMLRPWVSGALCQKGAVWSSGGTGIGPQGQGGGAGGGKWGRRSSQAVALNSEASRERGLPHMAGTSEEPPGNQNPTLHMGNSCPHWLTSHPSSP